MSIVVQPEKEQASKSIVCRLDWSEGVKHWLHVKVNCNIEPIWDANTCHLLFPLVIWLDDKYWKCEEVNYSSEVLKSCLLQHFNLKNSFLIVLYCTVLQFVLSVNSSASNHFLFIALRCNNVYELNLHERNTNLRISNLYKPT